MWRKRLQVLTVFLLIPLGILFWYTNKEQISIRDIFVPSVPVMHIGDMPLRVEIANSDAERAKGLSGRAKLEHVDGLLFVFPTTDYHGMWMKDMRFPIDIIWIAEDLTVIGVEKNVSPDTYPQTFRPERPARYAIETDVHYSDTFGVQAGQVVRLPLKYLED